MLPCVVTGLKACVRTLTRPGDSVAIVTPVYGPFYGSIRSNGRAVRAVSLLRGRGGTRTGVAGRAPPKGAPFGAPENA